MSRVLFFPSILILALSLTLMACEKKRDDSKSKFIEYIVVEGICYEDHVREKDAYKAEYEGGIVHWYDLKKERHNIYGSVSNKSDMVEGVIEKFNKPYKYQPPFIITFLEIDLNKTLGNELTVKGISNYLSEESIPKYATTCKLRVIERKECMPGKGPDPEENKEYYNAHDITYCDQKEHFESSESNRLRD